MSTIAIRPDTSTGKKEERRDRHPADEPQPAVHALWPRHRLLDQGRHRLGGAPRAACAGRRSSSRSTRSSTSTAWIPSPIFLPPRPDGQASGTAVFLKKKDVGPELRKPLSDSIGAKTPTIGTMPKRGARTRQPHHGAEALHLRVSAGAGRRRGAHLRPGRPRDSRQHSDSRRAPESQARRRQSTARQAGLVADAGPDRGGSTPDRAVVLRLPGLAGSTATPSTASSS